MHCRLLVTAQGSPTNVGALTVWPRCRWRTPNPRPWLLLRRLWLPLQRWVLLRHRGEDTIALMGNLDGPHVRPKPEGPRQTPQQGVACRVPHIRHHLVAPPNA